MITRLRLAVVSFGLLSGPLLMATAAEAGFRGP